MSKHFDNICQVAVDTIVEVRHHGNIANKLHTATSFVWNSKSIPLHNRSLVPSHTWILGLFPQTWWLQTKLLASHLPISGIGIHCQSNFWNRHSLPKQFSSQMASGTTIRCSTFTNVVAIIHVHCQLNWDQLIQPLNGTQDIDEPY